MKKFISILLICLLIIPINIYADTSVPLLEIPEIGFGESIPCKEILGPSITQVLNLALLALRIFAVIYVVVSGMLSFLSATASSDANALNNAINKFVTMLVVVVIVMLLPTIISFIGNIFGYDLSCFA